MLHAVKSNTDYKVSGVNVFNLEQKWFLEQAVNKIFDTNCGRAVSSDAHLTTTAVVVGEFIVSGARIAYQAFRPIPFWLRERVAEAFVAA